MFLTDVKQTKVLHETQKAKMSEISISVMFKKKKKKLVHEYNQPLAESFSTYQP